MNLIVVLDSVTVPTQPLKHSKHPDAVHHAVPTISHSGLSRGAKRSVGDVPYHSFQRGGTVRCPRLRVAPTEEGFLPDVDR
jgi:hypothetical protein